MSQQLESFPQESKKDPLRKRRFVDLLVVIALTLIAVMLAFVVPASNMVLRIWTLPLIFILPGYALTSALFGKRSFGLLERIVFSLGLSLVGVILGGLVLNLTPFGMRANSWAAFLGSVTLGASVIALVRQRWQGISLSHLPGVRKIGLTFSQALLLGLAVLIIGGAVAVSIHGAEQQPYAGFTQLWILPADGSARAKDAVRLGVNNMEATVTDYRLVVTMDGRLLTQWTSLDLKPNQQWNTTLLLPQAQHTGSIKVEVMLYRTATPTTIYRQATLWLSP